MTKGTSLVTDSKSPEQLRLDLQIAVEREIDGVGMGVLSDGTPFLNIRGLARMCGVDHANIIRITADWMEKPAKSRVKKIRELVREQGADDNIAFIAIIKDGVVQHAIPSAVCMAILEYYAFETGSNNDAAAQNYRILARKGFNDFIYAQVGYNPTGAASIAWKQFHDRVSLAYDSVPDGYFSIFKEIATLLVTMLREGVNLGDKFIPDISVGIHWGKYWNSESLDIIYGERIRYDHNYPSYFPQSLSNPQPAYCYPDDALGEFRKWVREIYLPAKLPSYLDSKVKQGQLPAKSAVAAIEAFKPKAIKAS
ncbi:hypothetical protein SOQ14_09520 [Erythrobacter sp. T5W1-R]|uniref:hypothetical protein n=1 Tax=Erythrobacter sp. T5W1-R TaxID=3101752 RepID=UPI002AFDEB8E|nr:hypothetical protein [Erythrobacter sp. T5W1-R]MEA1619157.1 hypothetical protein [Erythrobacter sp. T5W1-R]